jgi:hypothetical protein
MSLSYRRTRKDKGKHRKKYAGKPTKKYQRIEYPKVRGHKSVLKLWVWQRLPMSQEGRRRFSAHVRPYMKPYIYRFGQRFDVPVNEIANKQLIENFAVEQIGYAGDFYIMGFSGTKRNKKKVKPVKLCQVVITEHPDGLKARMCHNWKLFRYWFWQKN